MWHEQHECDTSATRAARVRHECDTSNTNVTPVQHEQHEYDTSEARATRVQHKCDTSATRTTRVWHEWKTLILITTQVKTFFHTSTFTTWQVKDYKERSNFILRTTFWKRLDSIPNAFENCATKTELFNGKRYIKKLYIRLSLSFDAHARSRIATHSNAVSFLIKAILCENTNILFSRNCWKLGKNEC